VICSPLWNAIKLIERLREILKVPLHHIFEHNFPIERGINEQTQLWLVCSFHFIINTLELESIPLARFAFLFFSCHRRTSGWMMEIMNFQHPTAIAYSAEQQMPNNDDDAKAINEIKRFFFATFLPLPRLFFLLSLAAKGISSFA
jgi:hypothetical protein